MLSKIAAAFFISVLCYSSSAHADLPVSVAANLSGTAYLYEAVLASDSGTQDTGEAFRRDATYNSSIRFYRGARLSSTGTQLSINLIGGGVANSRIGGQAREATEWLLKKNTAYAIKYNSANANTQCLVDVEYYEDDI